MSTQTEPLPDKAHDAFERAIGLLARREHSRFELQRKLGERGFETDDIVAAMARLLEDGYQSEQRFGEALVRARIGRGYGPVRIRAELGRHRLDDGLIDALLEQADEDTHWLDLAVSLLRRHYRGKRAADFRERGKRAQFLQRRGFPGGLAMAAIEAANEDNA